MFEQATCKSFLRLFKNRLKLFKKLLTKMLSKKIPSVLPVMLFIFIFETKSLAIAPVVAGLAAMEGVKMISEAQDGIGTALDVLDSTDDLAEELGGENTGVPHSLTNFNRELAELKSDMRDLGYADQEISSLSERLSSNQSSLTQKIRTLRNTVRSVKNIKASMGRIFNKKGAEVAVQRGILSTEQQALHLQMQALQSQALKDLAEKRALMEDKKATERELSNTLREIAKKKQDQFSLMNHSPREFALSGIQNLSAKASLMLLIVGLIGVMFGLFREHGIGAIRTGVFGLILSYVLPGIVHLYRIWLGV